VSLFVRLRERLSFVLAVPAIRLAAVRVAAVRAPAVLVAASMVPASGCVYTDGINHPPEIEVIKETDTVYIGDDVVISAQNSRDPDGDSLTFEWSIEWRPLEGGSSSDIPSPLQCDRYVPPDKYCFKPQAKAVYDVHLTVTDQWGASRSTPVDQPVEVTVNNRPPIAKLDVTTLGNEFGEFTLGREIRLYAGGSWDEDEGDVLTFTWDVEVPEASRNLMTQTLNDSGQPTEDATEAVFFRMLPDVRGTYRVTVTVDDGSSEDPLVCCDEAYRDLHVIDDEPPCVEATDPDFSTGTLIFDRAEIRRLEVTRVSDDLDPYPGGPQASFAWSLEISPGDGFSPVTGYHFPYLDLEGVDYDLGQLIRVRVRPLDRVDREPPQCPESQQTCGSQCFEWVTWDIEFR
jgi:hypothetical protein